MLFKKNGFVQELIERVMYNLKNDIERILSEKRELAKKEVDLYAQEERVKIDDSLVKTKETVIDLKQKCLSEVVSIEHEYHYQKELKGIELAKLDAQIEGKQAFLEQLDKLAEKTNKVSDKELDSVRKSYEEIIKAKDSVISLLTDQCTVLTSKLTELKISDINITADLKKD